MKQETQIKLTGILSIVSAIAVLGAFSTGANAGKCTKSAGCTEACLSTIKAKKAGSCTIQCDDNSGDCTASDGCTKKFLKSIKQTDPTCGTCDIICEE